MPKPEQEREFFDADGDIPEDIEEDLPTLQHIIDALGFDPDEEWPEDD